MFRITIYSIMTFLSSLIVTLLSAFLFAMGIPNEIFHFGNAIAGFLCFIPLYYVFFISNSRLKTALIYSFFVTFTHLFSSFWLINFQDFAIFTLGASTVAYFVLALPFGVFFHYIFSSSNIKHRPFLFALTLTMWEYFKSSGFTAYPWGTIAMTTLSLKHFIQFIDVTGVWGISYMMALIGAIETEVILALLSFTNGFKKNKCNKIESRPLVVPIFITLFLIFIINIYGFFALSNSEISEKNISLLLVQQNVDPWNESLNKSIEVGQNLTREGLKKSKDVDLVVWSESSLSIAYEEYKEIYKTLPQEDPFISFLKEIDCPIFVGTPIHGHDDHNKTFNGVCLIDKNGEVLGYYSKMQLVPFAEFIPFIDYPLVQKIFDKIVGFSSGWAQGSVYKLFNIKNKEGKEIYFTSPICYEDAFPSLCASLHNKGSDLLLNLTNDSWSKTDSAEYQHFAIAYFRAIELRTSLVRSTNAGFTCVVTPKGNIISSLPLFKEGYLHVTVPIYSHKTTPYALFKDWLPLFLFVILIRYIWTHQTLYKINKNEEIYPHCHWEKEKVFTRSIKLTKKRVRFIGIKLSPSKKKNIKKLKEF